MAEMAMQPGALKAAAFLLGIGPEIAREVFRHLDESQVKRIAAGARELRRNPADHMQTALREFVDRMESASMDTLLGDDLLRQAAAEALGEEAARRVFDADKPQPSQEDVLGGVVDADPEALAMILSREQPQTVAVVLSALPLERATLVLEKLPADARPAVLRRMARLDAVSPEVLREIRQALTSELGSLVAEGMRRLDGRTAALELIRRSTGAQQTEVLAEIDKDDPALAAELRSRIFTFDDLSRLTDRDIQQLAKDIDGKQLVVALKGASPEVRDKFLRNMSTRAAELLNDDLQALGPVKLAQVEEAQGAIAKTALDLADAGKITLVRLNDQLL